MDYSKRVKALAMLQTLAKGHNIVVTLPGQVHYPDKEYAGYNPASWDKPQAVSGILDKEAVKESMDGECDRVVSTKDRVVQIVPPTPAKFIKCDIVIEDEGPDPKDYPATVVAALEKNQVKWPGGKGA